MNLMQSIRNLFTKQSKTTRLLVAYGSGQPVWTDTDYEKLADEGYQKNTYVFRAINIVAMACGGIPWLLYRKRGKNKRELDDHALIKLMERPNPQQGQAKFVENMIAYLMISGNSYIERVGPKRGTPKELYALRPDRMLVIKGDARQPIRGYEYRVDGQPFLFDHELIMHLKTFNPLDDWYGLPPLHPAARAIDQNNEAKAWNVAMLQNSASPSGAFVTENALGDTQFDRLKEEMEEKYQGSLNAGRPMLLEDGLDWKQISLNPKDMEWIEGQKISAREIAMAFGVPSEMLGDSANKTYSNYKEARQAFYMETILPLMDWLRDEFNNWLTPLFGDNLYLDYDTDEIEAIQEDRTLVWQRSAEAVKSGLLTINEARESMGYETHPDGDILLVPSTMQPLGQVEEEPEPDPPDKPPQQPNNEDDTKPTNDQKVAWKAFHLQSNEQKQTYLKAVDQLQIKWEQAVQLQVSDQFNQERQQVKQAISNAPTVDAAINRANNAIDMDSWTKLYTAIYQGIIEDFGERTQRSLKSYTQVEIKASWLDAILSFITSTVAEKVVQVTNTTKQQIKDIVQIGITAGESIDQIATRVDRLYLDEIIPNRSEVISRTEVISASNSGSHYGAKATGLNLQKVWLATDDSRTRPGHKRMDGETKQMDERYSNGLLFPGDPSSGNAKETIQCRCTQFYQVIGGEADGN